MKELFEKKQTGPKPRSSRSNTTCQGQSWAAGAWKRWGATTYGSYLNFTGITKRNYPVFLNMLTVRNHSVIDALLGTRDPFLFMSSIQPNYFIVSTCFSFLTSTGRRRSIPKTLGIILGYSRPPTTRPWTATRSIRPAWRT